MVCYGLSPLKNEICFRAKDEVTIATDPLRDMTALIARAHCAKTMAPVAPLWGLLADRYGRKIMVMRAMFGGAAIISLIGAAQNVYQLLVLQEAC
jgi:DHA1 family multidrug resistance protein-like MFS transporter